MKKLITFSILTYLLLTINSFAVNQNSDENNLENEKILKIGVLLPLSGKFQEIGESFLTEPGELSNLVSSACKEINKTNKDPELATDGGTSDARFIKDYCEILEVGLVNRTLHQVNEYVKTEDLNKLHNLYLRILEKYFNKV